MGGGPSKPSAEHAAELRDGLDAACAEAARLIGEADIFLLCTGAGFSADSGLAVYADVAKVPVYAQRGLEYHDICQPLWLWKDPELFWGFWGQCYNDYRGTAPHVGYEIIDRWADRHRRGAMANSIRKRLADRDTEKAEKRKTGSESAPSEREPYTVEDHAGGFFVFTSNVDAHHFDWFRACEIRECHGNTELYQCAGEEGEDGEQCRGVWRAPLDFDFRVEKTSMLAPGPLGRRSKNGGDDSPAAPCPGVAGFGSLVKKLCDKREQEDTAPAGEADAVAGTIEASADQPAGAEQELTAQPVDQAEVAKQDEAPLLEKGQDASDSDMVPRVGHVRGGGRGHTLRNMPGVAPEAAESGFKTNHPACPSCGGRARPAILMFGDAGWQDVKSQAQRWKAWQISVKAEIQAAVETCSDTGDRKPRVAILEIGAGGNVPTVRGTAERSLRIYKGAGADVKLIRVNPDFPLADQEELQPGAALENCMVSVMARGLESVMRIDAAMTGPRS